MSLSAYPSTPIESTAAGFATGLVGSIGVRLLDGQGGTTMARKTTGIIESPAGSGIYIATFTTPSVAGQYQIVWDHGGNYAVEDLSVGPTVTSGYTPDGTARATMADIIYKVRMMIEDTDCNVFTDREVEEALDARSDEARYYPLEPKPTIAPGGGSTDYLIHDAPVGVWESSPEIVDSAYYVLTPATSDLWIGRWTFSTEPSYPVMITGTTYDVYGAAGDLMMIMSGREFRSFDVSADGISLSRSQKAEMLAARAREYHAKARTRSSNLVRTDEC